MEHDESEEEEEHMDGDQPETTIAAGNVPDLDFHGWTSANVSISTVIYENLRRLNK